MKKDTIVQFVCFVTNLDISEFEPRWELFAERFTTGRVEINLEQQSQPSRYKYVSRVIWPQEDFLFSFKDKKRTEHFPEHKVKLIQAGGYSIIQTQKRPANRSKIMAFIGHDDNNIEFYKSLPDCTMNIYQAYYESCSFAYIFEFFVDNKSIADITEQLKKQGAEIGVYEDCPVSENAARLIA